MMVNREDFNAILDRLDAKDMDIGVEVKKPSSSYSFSSDLRMGSCEPMPSPIIHRKDKGRVQITLTFETDRV
jgi:hypothetical protein